MLVGSVTSSNTNSETLDLIIGIDAVFEIYPN
jgi:hypothetical protein